MFLILRVLFTILSAICVAAVIPVGTFLGWGWGGLCGFLAILFFVFMRLFKTQQELQEMKTESSTQTNEAPDFFHPTERNKDDE
ncbi:MAG: hypothetical protein IJ329_00800 [Clostridia bacterium]|nr:hypothetical protein [Clostridia bacterium]